jgi:hypothetical protein
VRKAGPVFDNDNASGSWDKIEVYFGDHAPFMQRIVANLQQAEKYAANETEVKMVQSYIKCFAEGDIEDHKEGSRHWIRDKVGVSDDIPDCCTALLIRHMFVFIFFLFLHFRILSLSSFISLQLSTQA